MEQEDLMRDPGRKAYEDMLRKNPTYVNSSLPRPTWEQLSPQAQAAWRKSHG